jgi:hypothetical protein
MGGRRRFLRTTLAALAALVLLAGLGAGVWVASSDEDESPLAIAETPQGEVEADAPADQPPPAVQEPAGPGEEPEPAAPEATAPESPDSPPAPEASAPEATAPEPSAPAGESNTTRFPRERNEDPSRSGKRFSVPPAHEFTGTGNTLIGTVNVRQPALVKWTSRGDFGLEFGREAFPIIAPSRSGQLVVPPYRFELVRVLAKGRWTITVTPQP